MKLYLAGYQTGQKFFGQAPCIDKINFLESYLYFQKYGMKKHFDLYGKKFLLDSGAFTAHTQKTEINIVAYCEFIKRNLDYIETYANLDVIGDAEKTRENQKFMEYSGLKPLPTYHFGEEKKRFEKYVNEYEYVGIGGLVPHTRQPDNIRKILDYCFHYTTSHNLKTKFHGWGMTNTKFMKRYPFYSVDSTGRLAGGKFNTIFFYRNGELNITSSDAMRKKLGIDFGKKSYIEKDIQNIVELYRFIQYVTDLHKANGMQYRA